ncbi:MAG: reductase [Ruminococcus sp.]|nr:reductase [Ruminococcus sp.]
MDILIIGGTRYFGIPMTEKLIDKGHNITIATRGITADKYGDKVSRIVFDHSDDKSIRDAAGGRRYDIIIDKIAYSSNDVKRILDNISCGKYILMSSSAVYENIRRDTPEEDFDPMEHSLEWCERQDHDYGEVKRQAECALVQNYPDQDYIAVRYPVVIGENDYTGRLRFYVEKIISGGSMYIDDMDSRISFIYEKEAGEFLAHIAESSFSGAVNACSEGDISVAEIIAYIEERTGRKAVLSEAGEPAPYNGYPRQATLDTSRAHSSGFVFSDVKEYFRRTIDHYIEELK